MTTQDTLVFEVFCAKMGKPKLPIPEFVGTCSSRCCDSSCFPKKVQEICSNPLKGQAITLSEPITFPNYLPPEMFNTGGKMSGSLFNMFVYASSYYGFKPKIDVDVDAGTCT